MYIYIYIGGPHICPPKRQLCFCFVHIMVASVGWTACSSSINKRYCKVVIHDPYLISPSFRVIKIAAGETHSLAITEYGDVFMWGNNEFLQPELVVALDGINIVDIGAGWKYSACLSDQGELYTFGAGKRF